MDVGGDIRPSSAPESDLDAAYEGDVFENGRRYHAYKGGVEGEYWAPNDELQADQLDIAHHIFQLLMDGKLSLAPLDKTSLHNVLDIGTGTGIWAIDFADEHPETTVTGIDLSPTQPSWVPPNCHFEVDDCTEPWTFPEESFDFIHVRAMYGSIANWPELYGRIFKHLKPGGWIEQVEYSADWVSDDNSIPPGHIFETVSKSYIEAGKVNGRTFEIWEMQKDLIDQAGFVNTTEKRFKMPLGPWPADKNLKEIGRWHLLEVHQGLEGWSMALFTRFLKWSVDEVHAYIQQVKEGLKDKSIHAYTRGSIVYGQKPLA